MDDSERKPFGRWRPERFCNLGRRNRAALPNVARAPRRKTGVCWRRPFGVPSVVLSGAATRTRWRWRCRSSWAGWVPTASTWATLRSVRPPPPLAHKRSQAAVDFVLPLRQVCSSSARWASAASARWWTSSSSPCRSVGGPRSPPSSALPTRERNVRLSRQMVGPSDGSDYIVDFYGARLSRLGVTEHTYRKPHLAQ